MSRHHPGGRHELGQNFLSDRRVISDVVAAVRSTRGPILEIGAGDGALTVPLSRLGRPITALEIDPARAVRLDRRTPGHVSVIGADVLRFRMPRSPGTVVGNIPFHITTAIMRKLLSEGVWTDAVLIVQWEVARRRAGVGGATMLTATSWPWYDYSLLRRIPSYAFRPVPGVDGGLLAIRRRPKPLVPDRDRARYERFVERVFTGRGHGLTEILRSSGSIAASDLPRWLDGNRIERRTLPRNLRAEQWASLWAIVQRR